MGSINLSNYSNAGLSGVKTGLSSGYPTIGSQDYWDWNINNTMYGNPSSFTGSIDSTSGINKFGNSTNNGFSWSNAIGLGGLALSGAGTLLNAIQGNKYMDLYEQNLDRQDYWNRKNYEAQRTIYNNQLDAATNVAAGLAGQSLTDTQKSNINNSRKIAAL